MHLPSFQPLHYYIQTLNAIVTVAAESVVQRKQKLAARFRGNINDVEK